MLRVVVGFHFFKEGTNKLKSGDFTSAGFLTTARGPFAPFFRSMVDDYNGSQKLGVVIEEINGKQNLRISPEQTVDIWDDFCDRARDYYGFGSIELQEKLVAERKRLADVITTARAENDSGVDTRALEKQRSDLEIAIKQIREQPKRVQEILESHQEYLVDWIKTNRIELTSHFSTEDRLQGFLRDGDKRSDAATEVDSLRYQVDQIKSDRSKKLRAWSSEVTTMWDSLEIKVNSLAVDKQKEQRSGPLALHRPFDQSTSRQNLVDKIIPWFDTIVGVCLILGLFTRLASFAAGAFLLSVTMTQPFWVPGVDPTYYIWIEVAACFLIFASLAGRIAGLDYFVHGYFASDEAKTQS